jgi:hypothetical protein
VPPPLAVNVVDAPGQTAFVPVMEQLGNGLTVKSTVGLAVPQVPVIITLYLVSSASVTGDFI